MANGFASEHSAFLLQIVKYVNVASLTILVADYLQMFQLEIELIWNAKWGLVKILFLLARYSPFFDVPLVFYYSMTHLSNHQCLVLYSITCWSTSFGIKISQAILIVRTYALSGNSRKVLICLSIPFVLVATSTMAFLAIFLRSLRFGTPLLPTVVGCHLTKGTSNILFANFVLLIFNETIVVIVTIWIGVKRYRHSRNPLIVTLYRDGIFYFVYLFFISAANVVVLVAGPHELLNLLTLFQRVMHSILSTRIVLHVRNAARGRETVVLLSDLRFGSRPDRRDRLSSTNQSTTFPPTIEEVIRLE